ncbi:AcrB/AcrD/AcrF family protein [Acetobacter lambici]|uniref:Efflux RND transporter permease subunit n=2 Tax=Acetobacter lambici TaxID=1332824 RepID=A0ABT1F1L3_9PROT|nr:efflux RND transporter permease subunit [Acetobacter lambici]MCP1242940.1 efflux RND transporter permease subunit [Acetobacter lambici]MCP1259107.1 efflux RND transporter permease subunit [Acetobacter lambici]NHO57491.1 AcrB/AcrD/AcrF family protein [Acetobacter lambici]
MSAPDTPPPRSAINLSDWSIRHRALVLFFMLVIVVAGVRSYFNLGRNEDPPFTVKTMVIEAMLPGATLEETTHQLTDRIEKKIQETPYFDYVKSYTVAGKTTIMVNLLGSTPKAQVADIWYQVRKKVGDIKPYLPSTTIGPFFDDEFGDTYGIIYAFTADGFSHRELRDYVETVRDTLLHVPDVAKIDTLGVQDEKIYVDFSPHTLSRLGINGVMIATALQAQNALVPSGTVDTGTEQIQVQPTGRFNTAEDVANVTVYAGGRKIRLGDIATITRGYADPPQTQFRVNGHSAIGLALAMTTGGNVLALERNVTARMAELHARMPIGMEAHLVANQPQVVKDAVGDFTSALFEAIAIVLGISFLSLGGRAGTVVAFCIPFVLAVVFTSMEILGIDLQRVSLGALIIALGLLVDDAMITVESMVSKLEEGWSLPHAATFAYTSTAFPMLTGTLVTVAGFIPVGFAHSIAGEYTFSLFAVVGLALVVSWFVAVLIAPVIGVTILRPHTPQTTGPALAKAPTAESTGITPSDTTTPRVPPARAGGASSGATAPHRGRIMALFERCLLATMRHPRTTVLLSVAALGVSMLLAPLIPQQFFPASDRPELLVNLSLRQSASMTATGNASAKLDAMLRNDPDIDHWSSYIGRGAIRFYLPLDEQLPNDFFAQTVIVTKSAQARERVQRRLDTALSRDMPDVVHGLFPLELGPPVGWPVQYRVSGRDPEKVRQYAHDVARIMADGGNLHLINFDWGDPARKLRIDVRQEEAHRLGLSSATIALAINSTVTGMTATQLRDNIYLVDVVLRASNAERQSIEGLRNLDIRLPNDLSVPLSSVASIAYVEDYPLIWRRNRLPTMTIQAQLANGVQANTEVAALAGKIAAFNAHLPPGYTVTVGGTVEESTKAQKSVLAVMPVMALIMMAVLMVQLQSFKRLALVLSVAPFGLIGVVAALLITRNPIGFIALLGLVALVGMIIRNSVILVHQITIEQQDGKAEWDAVVAAAMIRFRPIMLTAVAAILGMLPIASSVFWGPMADVIMGGLAVATALTLIFLPSLYVLWFHVREPTPPTVEGATP